MTNAILLTLLSAAFMILHGTIGFGTSGTTMQSRLGDSVHSRLHTSTTGGGASCEITPFTFTIDLALNV
jgi:hypothetical protein